VITLQQQPNDAACYVVPRVAAAASSESPEQLMARGAAAFTADKFAEATAIYTQVVELCRGAAAANNGDFLKRALLNRSGALFFLGEHERALSDAQELCTKSHPQLAKAWARCAAALQGLKRYAEAADAFTAAAQVTDRKGAEEPAVYLQSANEMRAIATLDKTAPLAVALLRKGLTEEQIVHDGWTALMSLPQDVVAAITATTTTEFDAVESKMARDKIQLEEHVTRNVFKVKPSSPLSCQLWCLTVLLSVRTSPYRVDMRHVRMDAVRDAIVAVRMQATTADACQSWCLLISDLGFVGRGNQQTFGTAEVRDALVALQPQATTATACRQWCTAIVNLTDFCSTNQRLFGTAAVRDALVALRAQVTTAACPTACRWWCEVVDNLADNDTVKWQLLCTTAVRDALVAVRPLVTTDDVCRRWCRTICSLTVDHAANRQLFGTPAVRDALVALSPQATTAEGCYWWCAAICNVTADNSVNQQLLGTPAVRDALVALGSYATTANASHVWCASILNLVKCNDNQQLFATVSARSAHAAMRQIAATHPMVKGCWDRVYEILKEPRRST
jgi:hypothetical protein